MGNWTAEEAAEATGSTVEEVEHAWEMAREDISGGSSGDDSDDD